MISVVVPSGGAEPPVVATLAALVPGAAAGLIREVFLVAPKGSDAIARVADVAGCHFVAHDGTRAAALAEGARQAHSPWLMFLHAGAVLDAGWIEETTHFIQNVSANGRERAAVFRYARPPFENAGMRSGMRSGMRRLARFIAGPAADQGLLISRTHYDRLGGYAPNARRAEAELLSKLGRTGRALLRTRIFVGA